MKAHDGFLKGHGQSLFKARKRNLEKFLEKFF